MAKVNDKGIAGVGDGILIPLLKHSWRLRFTGKKSLFSDENLQFLAAQIVSCSFDYHLQILSMVFEQDRFSSKLHDLVKQFNTISKSSSNVDQVSFVVEMLDGGDTILQSFKFYGCVLVGHLFELDYASSEIAKHNLKFSFKSSKEL